MSPDILKTVFLPLALFIILLGMGLSLSLADFKRVLQSPLASAVGLFSQFVLLPLIALGLIRALGLSGEIAVGLMLLASCPGGPTSNLITHLCKGDTALSVTLTALSSMLAVFTLPWIVGLSMTHFLGDAATIQLPFLKTLLQLFVITILPVALGMWVRATRPGFAARMSRPANAISLIFLALIIALVFVREKDLLGQFRKAGPGAILLNVVAMFLAFTAARIFRLSRPQSITISIEAGIQSGTLALAIALGLLDNDRIAIPAVVYSLFMFISGGAMIAYFGWWKNSTLEEKPFGNA